MRLKPFKTALASYENYKIYIDEDSNIPLVVNTNTNKEYRTQLKLTSSYDLIGTCECKDFMVKSRERDAPCKHCYIASFSKIQEILQLDKPKHHQSGFILKYSQGIEKIDFLTGLNSFVEKYKTLARKTNQSNAEKIVSRHVTRQEERAMTKTTKEPFVSPYGDIPEQFVIKIHGKPYVRQEGLIVLAKKLGLKSVRTQPIQWSHESRDQKAIFKATVNFEDGSEFEAYGVASPENVKAEQFLKHLDHLAETRSRCRALRLALASGLVAVEELTTPESKELENYG